MLFDTLEFWLFLGVVLAVYFALARNSQNLWLLVASYTFYGFWDWRFLSLIAFSTVVDYSLARRIPRADKHHARQLLILSLLSNLGILFTFKYFNFFVDSFIDMGALLGLNFDTPALRLVPPIGISFYTFQTIAYTFDVYRGQIKPERNFICFAVFVSYFPQLVAGPIERASHLLPQFRAHRKVTTACLKAGLLLILIGLFKKVVIADSAGVRVNEIFVNPALHSSWTLWKGALLFSLQIYGDFSGYSNMARGISRLFGVRLSENFKTPYFARNISDFWKRWHITLSEWLRDYLYVSLGGNKQGQHRTFRNLMVTMLLGGLWHGASFTFVLWGAVHGLLLVIFHAWRSVKKRLSIHAASASAKTIAAWLSTGLTFFLVCLTFVLFRSEDMNMALQYFNGLFGWRGSPSVHDAALPLMLTTLLLPIEIYQYRNNGDLMGLNRLHWLVRGCLYSFLIISVVFSTHHEIPFIYFQF